MHICMHTFEWSFYIDQIFPVPDCVLDGSQHADGATWRDGCNTCRCAGGRATCLPVSCDCSAVAPRADPGCCPQCYDQQVCRHQRIPGLAYTSGQRWIHDCMECECMVSAVIYI